MGRALQGDPGGSINIKSPRASAHRSGLQRTSTHWTGSHVQRFVPAWNIPFSEVIGAWYQANNYNWERLLLVDSGRLQLVRSCNEPREIATASIVMRIAKTLLNEIDADDNVPYYTMIEFVKAREGECGVDVPGRIEK